MSAALKEENVLFFSLKEEQKEGPTNKKNNTYFYKVTNHAELYKLGSSFLKDFKAGLKSFAISSTGYYTSQQKTILGLASFFDHYADLKIAIISDNLFHGYFQNIIQDSDERELELPNSNFTLPFFAFYHHFDFIDLNLLLDITGSTHTTDCEQHLEDLMQYYDCIFWDIPELHKLQNAPQSYYPIIQRFDSLTIIASQSVSHSAEIDSIREFFAAYNIGIKGLIFDPFSHEGNRLPTKKKKPWWKLVA